MLIFPKFIVEGRPLAVRASRSATQEHSARFLDFAAVLMFLFRVSPYFRLDQFNRSVKMVYGQWRR